MTGKIFESAFFINNRKRFCHCLPEKSIAIFHSSELMPRTGDQFFPFRQCSDFLYLTGINQYASILMLAPDYFDDDMKEMLFISKPSDEKLVWEGKKLSKEQAQEISGIQNIFWLTKFDDALKILMTWAHKVFLNVAEKPKFSTEIQSPSLRFAHSLRQNYPLHTLDRAAPIMRKLRMIKTREEINMIKTAIDITGKAFRRAIKFVEPGVAEFRIQAEIEYQMKFDGAGNQAFYPIVASGENACILHYNQNDATCNDGDLLLLDFGAEYGHYAADISRTIPVNGKFSPRQRQFYKLVLKIQKATIKQFIPGNSLKKVNEFVLQEMEKALIKIGLCENSENDANEQTCVKKFFMHGVAHHLGMDVHDTFDANEPFEPGMIFTVEPGVYIPDEKTGIRLENIILVTENQPLDLSDNIPIFPDEIEKLMKK
jgi:Xaa-Pro aminopeptidase